MLIENISPNPITLSAIYTIPAGAQATVPFQGVLDDTTFVGYMDANQLRVINAEEALTLRTLPRFTQGQLFLPQTLTAGESGFVPTIGTTSNPVLLWVAPFQVVRLYLNVTAGDMTVNITDSPDGGVTFYPVPNMPTLTATYTTPGTGLASALLPEGLCLLKCTLSSVNGGTASVWYSRQSYN